MSSASRKYRSLSASLPRPSMMYASARTPGYSGLAGPLPSSRSTASARRWIRSLSSIRMLRMAAARLVSATERGTARSAGGSDSRTPTRSRSIRSPSGSSLPVTNAKLLPQACCRSCVVRWAGPRIRRASSKASRAAGDFAHVLPYSPSRLALTSRSRMARASSLRAPAVRSVSSRARARLAVASAYSPRFRYVSPTVRRPRASSSGRSANRSANCFVASSRIWTTRTSRPPPSIPGLAKPRMPCSTSLARVARRASRSASCSALRARIHWTPVVTTPATSSRNAASTPATSSLWRRANRPSW